ncbi:DUF2059 domain-containing protein [Jannaschia pohangensis]|uniref:Uncharacterized protein n=1 Tax=Jannaschia pohangensis TaxID=390807 RepID=A0A1I3GY63_9RHOB|nr:DUF2059 domain-containing protein [Jannaschia pohangensis]SFI28242.1 hypothetical protein SAMN04488095_0375 [Jannaschia pohangensis]
MKKLTRIVTATLLGFGLAYGAAQAEPIPTLQAEVDPVADVMRAAQIEALMQVVATEGARHGIRLEGSLFPGRGGGAWAKAVSVIQSPERLFSLIDETLRRELSPQDVQAVTAFLDSDLGARIIHSEVTARRHMLDVGIESGAKAASAMLLSEGTARAHLIEEMMTRLGLVETNVSGGLNANFAFYKGLGDGGALASRLTESEMISMVWDQESAVRDATQSWLRGYLTLAYTPFSEEELRLYIDFAETDAGRRYTAAMFAGYGRVFETTSYDLGRAAARFIAEDAI